MVPLPARLVGVAARPVDQFDAGAVRWPARRYYPLSDDGTRNFVDLNTIPDDIVDRVEVLRDGASSSYGADAIAGVVNIITKRSVKGVMGRAEAGISQRGYNANQRVSLTAGTGDLDEQGYNAYVSGFYYRSEGVRASQLPAPTTPATSAASVPTAPARWSAARTISPTAWTRTISSPTASRSNTRTSMSARRMRPTRLRSAAISC